MAARPKRRMPLRRKRSRAALWSSRVAWRAMITIAHAEGGDLARERPIRSGVGIKTRKRKEPRKFASRVCAERGISWGWLRLVGHHKIAPRQFVPAHERSGQLGHAGRPGHVTQVA